MPHPLAIGFLPAGLVIMMSAATAGDDNPPPFKITTKRDNDRVEVKSEKDKTVFSVHSPFGISNAVIERTSEKWPNAVVLRLHLIGGDGKPTKAIPLKDGYFEMPLPQAVFEGNPKAITVNWIDFYRN